MTARPLRSEPAAIPAVNRVLGRIRAERPGPTLVAVGGLHGNEPAGVLALRRILDRLRGEWGPALRGEFVAIAGNRGALARGRRFLRRDLNRAWTHERVRSLRSGARAEERTDEDREQLELLRILDEIHHDARGDVHVLDLHTTSSVSGPWATVEDTLRNRSFALNFPVPIILGLEEQVEGTLLEHLGRSGHVGLTFESGQHGDPRSVDRTEAAVWVALGASGVLVDPRLGAVRRARRRLEDQTTALPRVLEVRHRHRIRPGDGFRMRPGYVNLQPVRRGEVLAHDRDGRIVAPETGRVLMPLYQPQGEDGFFLAREFRPFWLRVSAGLRRLELGRAVHWLPGIERVPQDPETLVVDRRIARWFALELLHLLGFRKQRIDEAGRLIVRRRPER